MPRRRSIDAFTQACRSIGEPILGLPLHEISIARLLAQLFQVTEQFEMETQPQLLLLQKTMVLVEGIGRRLDPSVNIWTLARPIVEQWMRENRGPEAQLRQQIDTLIDSLAGGAAGVARSRPDRRRLVARRASSCTPRASPRRHRTGRACCCCWWSRCGLPDWRWWRSRWRRFSAEKASRPAVSAVAWPIADAAGSAAAGTANPGSATRTRYRV